MSYINIVMPLQDFIVYIKEAVNKHAAHIYLEQKTARDTITIFKLDLDNIELTSPEKTIQD